MCVMIYLASDDPLPTQVWDQSNPRFQIDEVSEPPESIRRHFTKKRIYSAVSHEGCGCGFQWGEFEGCEDEVELRAKQESRRRLAEYISEALEHQPAVEVYACWDCDQAMPAEQTKRVRPEYLVRESTYFRERELLVISAQ